MLNCYYSCYATVKMNPEVSYVTLKILKGVHLNHTRDLTIFHHHSDIVLTLQIKKYRSFWEGILIVKVHGRMGFWHFFCQNSLGKPVGFTLTGELLKGSHTSQVRKFQEYVWKAVLTLSYLNKITCTSNFSCLFQYCFGLSYILWWHQ